MSRLLVFGAVIAALGSGLQKSGPAVRYKSVEPIFKRNCVPCHRGSNPAHGLDLSSLKKILRGDREGRVVIPGKPASSRLAKVLHGKPILMPPGGELSRADVRKIEEWIRLGAK